jgi:hypothetical protein
MAKKTKRKKTGSIKGFTCHAKAIFFMRDGDQKYIEQASFTIRGETDLKMLKESEDVNQVICGWISGLIDEFGYDKERVRFGVDKWIPLR